MGYKLNIDIDMPNIVDPEKFVRDVRAMLPGNAALEYEVDDLDPTLDNTGDDIDVEVPSHYYSSTT